MEYLIRPCQKNDLPALIDLCQKHSAYEGAFYNPEGKEDCLKKAIFSDSPKLFCQVIEIVGQVKGYFSFTFDYSTWDAQTFLYLDCLYLEPECRGMKIGETIFAELKSIAKEHHCVNIQWQTPSFNERAIKFYIRIGATGKDKVRFFIPL